MHTKNGTAVPMGSACLGNVLSRLDRVKAAGPGKWIARCPAHDDKTPSLGIAEAEDGKVLLHCWAGCTARDITAAIGLELSDLFPGCKLPRRGLSGAAKQLEATIIKIALNTLRQGKELSASDRERFELAKKRLSGGAV